MRFLRKIAATDKLFGFIYRILGLNPHSETLLKKNFKAPWLNVIAYCQLDLFIKYSHICLLQLISIVSHKSEKLLLHLFVNIPFMQQNWLYAFSFLLTIWYMKKGLLDLKYFVYNVMCAIYEFEKFQQSSPFTVLASSFIFTLNFLQRAHLWAGQENKSSSYQVASRVIVQSSLTNKRNSSTTEPSFWEMTYSINFLII